MKRLITLIIIIIFLLTSTSYFYFHYLVNKNYQYNVDSFIIQPGDSLRHICSKLAKITFIPTEVCLVTVKLKQYNLKFGEYEFKDSYNFISILEAISLGKVKQYFITIPEGLTNQQIYKILENEPKLSEEVAAIYPEGSLLPETYNYTLNFSRNKLLKHMYKAQQAFIANFDLVHKIEIVVNLASIIEKEARVDNERALISSVYHNRLNNKMLLQADPTLIYDIRKGIDFNYILTRKDINENNSGFNSYKFPGLPPTPICNPGKAAIIAAIFPTSTNFFYFVSNNQGGHNFSTNLEQHNNFVREYKKGK